MSSGVVPFLTTIVSPVTKDCSWLGENDGRTYTLPYNRPYSPQGPSRGGKKLADMVTELVGDEKEAFLDLASGMLQWMPEKRKTAKELLDHAFFEKNSPRSRQK